MPMPTMRSAGLSMKKTVNNLASTVHFGLDVTSKSLAHYEDLVDLSQKISVKKPGFTPGFHRFRLCCSMQFGVNLFDRIVDQLIA
jgi:hypothetical protein